MPFKGCPYCDEVENHSAEPRAAFRGRTWREGSLSWALHHDPTGWWVIHDDGDVVTIEDVGACPFCGRGLGEVER